jgi:hypothetical protein
MTFRDVRSIRAETTRAARAPHFAEGSRNGPTGTEATDDPLRGRAAYAQFRMALDRLL